MSSSCSPTFPHKLNGPEDLISALHQVAAGLADATNHYFLKANYYDHVAGDRARWWLPALWLHEDTTRNFEMGADELRLDVLLDGERLDHWTRISVPYSEIWDILHQDTTGNPTPDGWVTCLYHNYDAMRMPPLPTPTESV